MQKLTITPEQIAEFIISNGATRAQAAEHFGIAVNSVYRYVDKLTGETAEQLKEIVKNNRKRKPATICESGESVITVTEKSEAVATGHRICGNSHPLICVETGEIYSSSTDAAEKIGVTQGAISQQITGRVQTCKGMHFFKVSDAQQNIAAISDAIKAANKKVETVEEKAQEEITKAKSEATAEIARIRTETSSQINELHAKNAELTDALAPLKEIKATKAALIEHEAKRKELYDLLVKEQEEINALQDKLAALYKEI